jgi:hypothetical protein
MPRGWSRMKSTTFAYRKFPFGLRIAGGTFQWAMPYVFHEIKHIVEAFLDYLIAHSQ